MTEAEKRTVLAEYNARHPDRPGTRVLGPHHDPRSEVTYFVVLTGNDAVAYYPDGNPNQATDDRLAAIARRLLRVDTLLPRGQYALDVRSLGVAGVRDALPQAYEAGRADGVGDGVAEAAEAPRPSAEASATLAGIVAEEAEKALWHRKRSGRYDPSDMGHERLMELLRAVAVRAFAAGRTLPAGEVFVTVEGGVVEDIEGLPLGWTWRLEDGDVEV